MEKAVSNLELQNKVSSSKNSSQSKKEFKHCETVKKSSNAQPLLMTCHTKKQTDKQQHLHFFLC